MIAVTGITGQLGGHVARALLSHAYAVRAVLRDAAKAAPWAEKGCEVALAGMHDAEALTRAFRGAEAVFVLLPPVFDPAPDMGDARASIAALRAAIVAVRPNHVVCLSTIGAQAPRPNLLNALGLMEDTFSELDLPMTFLRAAWFMENYQWDVESARSHGVIRSHLQPLDRGIAMVATQDIGALAARLLMEPPASGRRVVQLEGPQRTSPAQVAEAFAGALGRPVRAEAIPRDQWEADFVAQGMRNPLPRMQMIDGFNEGWIDFEGPTLRGETSIEVVVRQLAA